MIFPTTFGAGIALLILTLLALGSWAVTFKRARGFRYELYYFDFAWGFLICALLAAFTLGSFDSKELTFSDNLLITGYRKIAYALGAGVLFNLGNVLLTGAISAVGMALTLPIAFGVALLVSSVWNYAWNPQANVFLVFGGLLLVIASIVVLAYAYNSYCDAQMEAKKKAALAPDPRARRSSRKESSGAALGIALSVVSGIILGFFAPIAGWATEGDNGVAPYGFLLLMAAAVFFSTAAFTPFTLAFPMAGKPAKLSQYLRASVSQHVLGIMGGLLLSAGLLSLFVVSGSPVANQVGPALITGLEYGAALVALIWGAFSLHEFQGASERIRMLLAVTGVLYAAGLAMVAIAPLYRS